MRDRAARALRLLFLPTRLGGELEPDLRPERVPAVPARRAPRRRGRNPGSARAAERRKCAVVPRGLQTLRSAAGADLFPDGGMDAHARPSGGSAGARAPSGRPGRAGGRRWRTRLSGEGFAPAAGPARRDVPATGRLARGARAGRSERRHALRSGAPPGARVKDAVGAVQSLLVLGGTSEIGLATARTLVEGRTRR